MSTMISDVSRLESARKQFDDATHRVLRAFGVADGKFYASGNGRFFSGSELEVRTASSFRGVTWRIDDGESQLRLIVTVNGEERPLGVIESTRLRDDFGHVAYVVDQTPYDHRHALELMIVTGIMEEK